MKTLFICLVVVTGVVMGVVWCARTGAEEVAKQDPNQPKTERDLCKEGNQLLMDGLKAGEDRVKLLGQACDKYAEAVRIKPDSYPAHFNWGLALLTWASLPGADAVHLYEQAADKYQKAAEIKPDVCEAYNNWAAALLGMRTRHLL